MLTHSLPSSLVVVLNQPHQQYFDPPVTPWSDGLLELLRTAWNRAREAADTMIALITDLVHLGVTKYLPITL